MNTPLLARIAPALFVLIWSTGWIVGRAIAPYAEPLWFLVVRYSCAIIVLFLFALASKASFPRSRLLIVRAASCYLSCRRVGGD
jgi:drug/metabolite transporter (DMT)-like permease